MIRKGLVLYIGHYFFNEPYSQSSFFPDIKVMVQIGVFNIFEIERFAVIDDLDHQVSEPDSDLQSDLSVFFILIGMTNDVAASLVDGQFDIERFLGRTGRRIANPLHEILDRQEFNVFGFYFEAVKPTLGLKRQVVKDAVKKGI